MNNNPIDITALMLQAISLQILFRDFNNTDLMGELRAQDEVYLKKIIEQNEEILTLLRKEDINETRNS